MPWRALVDGDLAGAALDAVRAVASRPMQVHAVPSLATGLSGALLFWGSILLDLDAGLARQPFRAVLDQSLEAVGRVASDGSLYQGVTGLAWVLQHLHRRGLVGPASDAMADLEDLLLQNLRRQRWVCHDLTEGLAGLCLYGLERLPSPWAQAFLREAVGQLGALSVVRGEGITWPALDAAGRPSETRCNLGVSHGVCGAVAVLALCGQAGIDRENCFHLAVGGARWLLAQRAGDRYPMSVDASAAPSWSEENWGFGSAGTAAALLFAARVVRDRSIEQQALRALLASAERASRDARAEPGLWFGAAGLAQIFNRGHQATASPRLRDAARLQIERILGLRRDLGDGTFFEDAQSGRSDMFSVGSVGIALTLLAAAQNQEPSWDRLLLLS